MSDARLRRTLPILAPLLVIPSAIPVGGKAVERVLFEPSGLYSRGAGPELDAAGRTVREGDRRFDYLPGVTATESVQVELDGEGNILATHTMPVAGAQPSIVSRTSEWNQVAALQQVCGSPLRQEWQEILWGSGIGATDIVQIDLDADGTEELAMGATSSGGFARNDFFYVLGSTGVNEYTRAGQAIFIAPPV